MVITFVSNYINHHQLPFCRAMDKMKDEVEFEGRTYDVWMNYDRALGFSYGDYWKLPFSVSEPHTTEFDQGLEEGFAYLRSRGIL